MPNPVDFDELDALERELGPTLRQALRGTPLRAEFAASLRNEMQALPSGAARRRRGHLVLLPTRAWAGLAAIVVIGLASSVALLASRPQPANAAEVLSQVQAEAVTKLSTTDGAACSQTPGTGADTGGIAVAVAKGPGGGPATVTASPTDLSDKLAQELGVSGDRVRQAMIATMRADMPATLPPDPFASIAQQLGLSRQQVCSAFMDQQSGVGGVVVHFQGSPGAQRQSQQEVRLGGRPGKPDLDLSSATPEQVAAPAQRLGVTPERLAAAVRASAASLPTPPPPPSEQQIISRFAQNLGISEDKVRAAINKVEGNNGFYFAVPVPKFPNR